MDIYVLFCRRDSVRFLLCQQVNKQRKGNHLLVVTGKHLGQKNFETFWEDAFLMPKSWEKKKKAAPSTQVGQLFKVLSFWLKRKRSAREHIGSWSVCVISIRFFTSATVYRKMKRAKTEEDRQNVRDKLQELENQHHGHHHHPSPATIPLLNRCCCFSLLTGAVFTGIYATVSTFLRTCCSYFVLRHQLSAHNRLHLLFDMERWILYKAWTPRL